MIPVLKGYPEAVLRFWIAHPQGDAIDGSDDPYAVLWCAVLGSGRPEVVHVPRFTRAEIAQVLLEVGRFHGWDGRGEALPDDEALVADVERAAAGLPCQGWTELACALGRTTQWHPSFATANKVAHRLRAGVTADEVREALARAQGARRAA